MFIIKKIFKIFIGCEIHINCNTFKIFSKKKINIYDLAIPGVLPNFNFKIIKFIFLINFILKGSFFVLSFFERKLYFYYDLPKNYQITQNNFQNLFNLKILNKCLKTIIIKKIHIEEDAASSKKNNFNINVNYFRSGNCLIELVTEPLFNNYFCLFYFLKKIKKYFYKNNISKIKMHNSDMRVDLNISIINLVNLKKTKKMEIKNLNSYENIEKSINYEFLRQIFFLENKKKKKSQTRNNNGKYTSKIRTKCFSKNYNYNIDYDIGYIINFDYEIIKKEKKKKKIFFLKFPKKKYFFIKKQKNFFFYKNKYFLSKIINTKFFIIKKINKYKNILLYFYIKKYKIFYKLKNIFFNF